MTSRKAPTGAKHARCVAHEAYPTAPAGWLCFSDETAPTDDAIIGRMLWADDLEAIRAEHRAAWAVFQAENAPDGLAVRTVPFCSHGVKLTGASAAMGEHIGHQPATWADERYTAPVGQASDFHGGIPVSRFDGIREAVAA